MVVLYKGKQLPRPALEDAKILLSASYLVQILLYLLVQIVACQDHQAGECAIKCLFYRQNRMAQVGFELKLC